MSENIAPAPILTIEVAKTKLNIALTTMETSVQKLLDTEKELIYNEDNLVKIKDFIDKGDKALKTVIQKHKDLKAPAWQECQIWDNSLRAIKADIETPLARAQTKYTKLCKDIAARKAQEELERKEKEAITTLRSNFIINYSQKIASTDKLDDLTAIEREINLETARKDRYKDQLEDFKADCVPIRELLKNRKEQVKKLVELEEKRKVAEESGDDEAILKLEEQKEVISEHISEGAIKVQEKAVSLSSSGYSGGSYAVQQFPSIKAKRRQWEFEIADLDKLYKENPELVELVPRTDKIKELMKEKGKELSDKRKESGDKNPITEFTVGQIRFYLDEKY